MGNAGHVPDQWRMRAKGGAGAAPGCLVGIGRQGGLLLFRWWNCFSVPALSDA